MGFPKPYPLLPQPPNYVFSNLTQATGFPNPQSVFPQSLSWVSPIPNLISHMFLHVPPISNWGFPLPQSLTWVHHYPIPNPGFPNLIFFSLLPQSSTYVCPKPQYGFFRSPISHEIIRNRHIECCNWQELCMFALFTRKFWGEIPGFIHISPGTI